MHNLKELVGIKNAQMEAQNEEEAKEYLENLKVSLDFVIDEIKSGNNFGRRFNCFNCSLSLPETNAIHPNRYTTACADMAPIFALPRLQFLKCSELF
ncbi:MAG: hypothetical protein IPN29_02715 [Saprospiraceae bacterium]|nr:hypothetical protein [Saprospiraceae bacterium]